jgi:hypothetical protein
MEQGSVIPKLKKRAEAGQVESSQIRTKALGQRHDSVRSEISMIGAGQDNPESEDPAGMHSHRMLLALKWSTGSARNSLDTHDWKFKLHLSSSQVSASLA